MHMSTLCTIKNMNRSYFSNARYMIGVGFKILGPTPVPKLPQVTPPPPPPPPPEDMFLIFAQNNEAVLTSTHNLCFRGKKKENKVYPCKPQLFYIKVGCKGVYITRTCYPDALPTSISMLLTRLSKHQSRVQIFLRCFQYVYVLIEKR